MSNRLYLYHRPTFERVILAERGSFGWRQSRPAAQFAMELNNMLQRAANGLIETDGHQDDFILLMDDADGAPFAHDSFFRTTDQVMVLEPPLRWDGLMRTADQAALRRTLNVVSRPPVPPRGEEHPELRIVERLQRENAEMRAGLAYLKELFDLYQLHSRIEMHELYEGAAHPERRSYMERREVIWAKVVDWVTHAGRRLMGWM